MAVVTSPHVAALDRILEIVVLLNDDMTKDFERSGLTLSRARVIWELGLGGPQTQQALANTIGVSARNITGLVDGLVATGFVVREPHPTDRRATLVTFTEQGASTAQALQTGQRELAELLFADMPSAQFGCFVNGLDHVLAILRAATA